MSTSVPEVSETPTEKEETVLDRAVAKFDTLKKFVLSIGSISYICGFVAAQKYALENNLGLLNPLQIQFFLGGAIPALIICTGIYLYILMEKGLVLIERKIIDDKGQLATFLKKSKAYIISIAVVAFLVMVLAGSVKALDQIIGADIRFGAFLLAALMAVMLGYIVIKDRMLFRAGYLIPMAFILAALKIFYSYVYQELPQELGGMKPKIARLGLDKSKISKDLAFDLLSIYGDQFPIRVEVKHTKAQDKDEEEKDKIYRTDLVEILYENAEYMVIRPVYDQGRGKAVAINASEVRSFMEPLFYYNEDPTTYRIKKEAILEVVDLGYSWKPRKPSNKKLTELSPPKSPVTVHKIRK